MGVILKFPPAVKHVGNRPSQEMQSLIINQALAVLRVPKAASKLMKFYAAQATGFRPSLKTIQDAIGIDAHNISRSRSLLMAYGLIGYDGNNIFVDWLRLCAFASMQPQMMGQKKKWHINPIGRIYVDDDEKNDVHNYIWIRNSDEKRLYASYQATLQAIADGVKFPELEGKDIPEIDPQCLRDEKNDVHNYIGNEISCGWYNPFNEPDPVWVYQVPCLDAYGEIVGYVRYNQLLPF